MTWRSNPAVLIAVGALLVFGLAFGVGKLTKKETVAAPAPEAKVVSLPQSRPQVAGLDTGGSLPALKVRRQRRAPASSGTSSSPSAPQSETPSAPSSSPQAPSPTPTPTPSPSPAPQPTPTPNPGPAPPPDDPVIIDEE